MNTKTYRPEAPIVAEVIRDWIHEQPFSECASAPPFLIDTCEDWTKAYELTDLIMEALDKRRLAA